MDPNIPDTTNTTATTMDGAAAAMTTEGYGNKAFTQDEKTNLNDLGAPPAYAPPSYYPPASTVPPAGQTGYGQSIVNTQPNVMAYTVTSQQPAVIHNVVMAPPNSYCCLSCCILWFCNLLFGLIAFVFSMMSMSAFDGGNIEKARSYGRISLWLNVTGIVVTTVLFFVFFIILMAN